MDVFNSSLNLAHQQGRKADSFLAKGKFREAIECHQKAGELLSKSLLLTKYADALKSIKLQEDHHRRQIAIIQDKRARLAKQLQISQHNNAMADDDVAFRSESERVADHRPAIDISQYAYQTLDQLDTMLQNINFGGATSDEMTTSDAANCAVVKATKMHKSEQTIIEELRLTTDLLREHVRILSSESDRLKQELKEERADKERLREVNTVLSRKLAAYEGNNGGDGGKYTGALDVDNFSVDLPPLETPTFDFELFKQSTTT